MPGGVEAGGEKPPAIRLRGTRRWSSSAIIVLNYSIQLSASYPTLKNKTSQLPIIIGISSKNIFRKKGLT
jgi:hypothetical protein